MKSPEVVVSQSISNEILATDVSQMYSIAPDINEWDIDYSIGKFIANERKYLIKNKTTNTRLKISIILSEFFSLNGPNSFIINPRGIEEFIITFFPNASLINSENIPIQIVVSPIVTDVVKI